MWGREIMKLERERESGRESDWGIEFGVCGVG